MKEIMISVICIVTLIWACKKEDEKVIPDVEKTSSLTTEEREAADQMGTLIPLSQFEEMKASFQKDINPDDTRAVSYGRTVLEKVLVQKGCVGIRFYFAKDKEGKQTLIFIGVDKNGNDIVSPADAKVEGGSSETGGDGPLCPKQC
jgi:hypothetical protein